MALPSRKGVGKCSLAGSPRNKKIQIWSTLTLSLSQALSREARMMPPLGHPYTWHTAKCMEVLTGTCLPAELTFSPGTPNTESCWQPTATLLGQILSCLSLYRTLAVSPSLECSPFGMAAPPELFSIWVLKSDCCG